MPGVLGIRCRVGIKGSRLKNGTRLSVLLLNSEVHHREDSRQDEAAATGVSDPVEEHPILSFGRRQFGPDLADAPPSPKDWQKPNRLSCGRVSCCSARLPH